ncbi:MAG: hypothetical protein ACT4PK_00700 [Gammaproteobacteria bacterium]
MLRPIVMRAFAALVLALAASGAAQAKKPFSMTVQSLDGAGSLATTGSSFSSTGDTIDFLDPDALRSFFPTVDTSLVNAVLDFRGLDFVLGFANNGSLLTLTVPAFNNFTRTFGAATACVSALLCADGRRTALQQLKTFLESNPVFLKRLLSTLAYRSPIDPLAGNPDSLFSRSMRADYQNGFTHKVSQIWGCSTTAFNSTFGAPIQVAAAGDITDIFADARARQAALNARNEVGVGIVYATTTAESAGGDYRTTGIAMPLSYTVKLDGDPRKKVRIDVPLAYNDTEGATTYSLGLGVAYTHPVSDVWTLTPAIGAGATGSDDLGSAGGVSSYSITSAYTWRLGGFALSMGNAIGLYDALGLTIGDVEAEADISNTVLTNGLLLTGPNSLLARNMVMEFNFTDTRISGDDVYLDSYDELGVSLGFLKSNFGVIERYTKVGLSYLVGSGDFDDISSVRLNLSVRF